MVGSGVTWRLRDLGARMHGEGSNQKPWCAHSIRLMLIGRRLVVIKVAASGGFLRLTVL